jgi:hypothetical protein
MWEFNLFNTGFVMLQDFLQKHLVFLGIIIRTKTPCVFGYYNIIYIIAGLASDDINDIIIRTKNKN